MKKKHQYYKEGLFIRTQGKIQAAEAVKFLVQKEGINSRSLIGNASGEFCYYIKPIDLEIECDSIKAVERLYPGVKIFSWDEIQANPAIVNTVKTLALWI